MTDSLKWYYYDGDSWEDISAYVLVKHGCSARWGMQSNKYTDRLARAGEMTLGVKNPNGEFDPDDASVLAGWGINTKIKFEVAYDGIVYRRFYGYVEKIKFNDPSEKEHEAYVTIKDWMDYAYKRTLTESSIETYRRGGYAVDKVVDAVGVAPLATQYSEGDYEFEAIFDSITTTTKAATELNKIVLSENGYLYNRHDKVNGETLVFEAESYRNGLRTVSQLPKLTADCGYILKAGSATDHVLLAGTTDKLILNETQDAHINGTAQRYSRTHGENILNSITVTAYPKRVDTTEQTLYSLGTPIKISSGETKTITVKYQNKDTKESCNAITDLMIQPVATTDYTMNTKMDGTGTDLTSSLTVSVVYHTATANVTYTNASGYKGNIRKLELRGYGVYQDSEMKAKAEDTASITEYGNLELNIEQQYQRDTEAGGLLAQKILTAEKAPRTRLDKVQMIANTSSTHMLAFLNIDVGDMVKITESVLGLDDYYYIQGIEFEIIDGSVIVFSWLLTDTEPSVYNGGLSLIAIEFADYETENLEVPTEITSANRLTFGNVPELIDLPQMTITAWVYVNLDVSTGDFHKMDIVSGWVDDEGGFEYSLIDRLGVWEFYFIKVYEIAGGNWFTTNGLGNGYWAFVAVTVDRKDVTFQAFDVEIEETEFIAPDGNVGSWDGMDLCIGNIISTDLDTHLHNQFIGKITDVRFYNRILSKAERDALNTAGIGGANASEGLIFNAPYVRTSDLAHYTDLAMTESDTVIDAIGGYVGTPKDSPTARLLT